ncbi:MAG: phage terminase large subunit family protein, partial [Synergistaceae bacterium]|nr:phage terminase large subunit family protein [Synergistaceae bacterium]
MLVSRYSALPGPWRTSRFPYTQEPMDIFKDRWLERLTLCFATQTAKTEILLNIVGYAIDQDPGSGLFVYPTDEL